MNRAFIVTVVCGLAGQVAWAQESFTYTDLVKRLTDLESLAVLPAPGEKCMQWSSYDRRSKYDPKTGKYVGWSANGDGTGFIRTEGGRQVFAEIEGPGVIWRIWSARTGGGHLRIFLDGATTPAVDLPFVKYFDCTTRPFVYKSLCYMAARGQNCYVPIPFNKSCKIVADKGWGRYYHFTHTVYPKGTKLPTFRLPLSEQETAALARADTFFRTRMGTDPGAGRREEKTVGGNLTIEPGKAVMALDLKGSGAITAIRIKTDFADRDDETAALRELVLRIHWDGEKSPSVWSPLGDFFGTAPGINEYKSFPMGVTKKDGFYSFWYMPFATGAKVEIVNDGAKARKLHFQAVHSPLRRKIDTLGRFHAKWHRDALLPREPERAIDWTMLTTTGRGRFCGVMLHVWNPKGGWWGEGDEKFFVDGEKFPSTFGTGSEDYFGYAWCNPELFQRAFHNQTISMGNRGHVSVNRWHVGDNVPFNKSFEAAIEKYYSNKRPTLYGAIAYWYQAPGGKDPYTCVPIEQRWGYCVKPVVWKVKGAIEGENLTIIRKTGRTEKQAMHIFPKSKWSGDFHLWWTRGKVGDKLVLALPVAARGKYEIQAVLTKARDYGVVQLSLDDKKLGGTIELYNPDVIATKPLSLGTRELAKGAHELTVEITGANAKAVKAYMFGLDYVLLKPLE